LDASNQNDLRNLTKLVADFLGAKPVHRGKKKKRKAVAGG
jgi:hypothetical protein